MSLHRPYIRKNVRSEVEVNAPKNEQGQFLDANIGKPIEDGYDLGHKAGMSLEQSRPKLSRKG